MKSVNFMINVFLILMLFPFGINARINLPPSFENRLHNLKTLCQKTIDFSHSSSRIALSKLPVMFNFFRINNNVANDITPKKLMILMSDTGTYILVFVKDTFFFLIFAIFSLTIFQISLHRRRTSCKCQCACRCFRRAPSWEDKV